MKKKMLISAIVLGALMPICAFGLSVIFEPFMILGMFCGVSALFCLLVYLDLQNGKSPNLIPIGLGMIFFGVAFLCITDFYRTVLITLSTLYAIAGVIIFVIGIKNWSDRKYNRSRKVKRRMNKKIYTGIGMLVGGCALSVILFIIFPFIMVVGHVLVVVGLVYLGRGISESKNPPATTKCADNTYTAAGQSVSTSGNSTSGNSTSGNSTTPSSTYYRKREYCTRCGRDISYIDTGRIFTVDGLKYCESCKISVEKDIQIQHTVCSICGTDLPMENMHVIDDSLICHSCFLEKYGNFDDYEEETAMPIDDAVVSLRKQIIAEITKEPALTYKLSSLLWQDAANCFPNDRYHWDGAWFKLDLQTGKLSADVSTYPDQFGGSFEDSYKLSAEEFNDIAKKYNMSKELQAMRSDDDWEMLVNDELKAAVFFAFSVLKKKEEERKIADEKRYAVKISGDCTKRAPDMHLSRLTIDIDQRYSSRSIRVTNENGKYHLVYIRDSSTSYKNEKYPRVLSGVEAVWLEDRVQKAIDDPDRSTWQSLAGGDKMNVEIEGSKCSNVSFKYVTPIRKYKDLQQELEYLAQYGSIVNNWEEII